MLVIFTKPIPKEMKMKTLRELKNEIEKLELERKSLAEPNVDIRKYPDLSGAQILKLRKDESLVVSNKLKKLRAELKSLTDKEEEQEFLKNLKALGYTFEEVIAKLKGSSVAHTEGV